MIMAAPLFLELIHFRFETWSVCLSFVSLLALALVKILVPIRRSRPSINNS